MSTEGEKRQDPGDVVREGVRSLFGILGAIKDAVEETFDELRTGGKPARESATGQPEPGGQESPDPAAGSTGPPDFVIRGELDELRARVDALVSRVDALSTPPWEPGGDDPAGAEPGPTSGPESGRTDGTAPGGGSTSTGPADPTPEDGPDNVAASNDPTDGDYRFEVE